MHIGIRREDKNEWERRVPLVPNDLKELKEKFGIDAVVQPSTIRFFTDQDYCEAGIEVNEDISKANTIFAVKEIPKELFLEGKTYMFFAHVIKGQHHNMPMLKRMMELKCNLIDYERVVNERDQRLIFFGRFAGLAGILETMHAFGIKLKLQGHETLFEQIKQPYEYGILENAQEGLRRISEDLRVIGFPKEVAPIVVGFTGYGHVSQGAQELFDCMPHISISPDELIRNYDRFKNDNKHLYKVVFKEEDIVRRKSGKFDLQEYYEHPELYESKFEEYLPFLTILVNCIYWTEKYPRLVTKEYFKKSIEQNKKNNLQLIGDISCDINGSIEMTYKVTKPDVPTFTYFTDSELFKDDVHKDGITVMAVDNLPCELPRRASMEFSGVLKNYVYEIASADFNKSFEELKLSYPIKKALILHKGELTEEYKYLQQFLNAELK